jgi:sensor histidine kinase YesM
MTDQPTRRALTGASALRGLLRVAWQQALWSIPFALFFGLLYARRLEDYILCLKASLVFSYSIGLALWAARHLFVARVLEREAEPVAPPRFRVGLYFAVAALIGSYVGAFIIHFTILPHFMGSVRGVIVSGMFTLLFTALFTGINYAIVFYRQAVDRARAVEHARAELAEAELRALRAQIHPHFLFNTLNSIASLIGSNPLAAEDMTTRLAEVFRYTLRASEGEHARLGDELEFLRSYLEIERARFGGRLRVEEEIEPGLDSVLVPSLLLQPVVENAVRHGISPRPEGGTVRISARRAGDRLAVEVADDGPGIAADPPPAGGGFGLRSVRERLRAAGLADALTIDSVPGRGTRVRVLLPLVPDPPRPASPHSKGVSA